MFGQCSNIAEASRRTRAEAHYLNDEAGKHLDMGVSINFVSPLID